MNSCPETNICRGINRSAPAVKCTAPRSHDRRIVIQEAAQLYRVSEATPLQIEHYLSLAFEEAYKIGQKPVTPEIIESILAKDIDGIEPRLTRQGYNVKALSDLLNVRPAEIRSFLRSQLASGRTQELKAQMLAAGIPL